MAKPGDLDDIGGDATEASAPAPEPASEPQEASQPEAAAEEPQPGPGDKPERRDNRPEGYVTKGERDRIANELQQERQQRALYEDRFNKVVERFFKQAEPEQAQAEADPMPDYQNDPLGWIGWRQRQDEREATQRAEQQRQWQEQEQQAREFQDTLSRATARFQKVAAQRPEIAQTYDAVRAHVANLYAQQGYPEHQIPDLVARYEADVIRWARQEYVPIEDAIEQAAAKFGVSVQAKPQDQRQTPERDPATGQFVPSEAEKAAKVRESQERNASLSSAPGAPVKKMTGTELAKMTEEEMWRQFDTVGRKPGAKQFERDMGFR